MVRPRDYEASHGEGYFSKQFRESFSEHGFPLSTPSGGTIISRRIPAAVPGVHIADPSGHSLHDLIGSYPFYTSTDISRLPSEVEAIYAANPGYNFVTFTAVLNPFATQQVFPCPISTPNFIDGVMRYTRYKPHVIVAVRNVSSGNIIETAMSKHHIDRVRKSKKKGLTLHFTQNIEEAESAWMQMQAILNAKKDLTGLKAMSTHMIERQVRINGLEVLLAHLDGELVGVSTWVVNHQAAYSHTTAMSDSGRKALVGYAMYDYALRNLPFKYNDLRFVNLGSYASTAGMTSKTVEGLNYFKCGWSDLRYYSYMATAVLHPGLYEKLKEVTQTFNVMDYFPAYRNGELL